MTQQEKTGQEIADKEKAIEQLKVQLAAMTTEFKAKQYDLNMQIIEHGKDLFADVNFEELLTKGEAFHTAKIGPLEFKIKTLTKKETLYVDRRTKEYIKETRDAYISAVQVDSMAFIIVKYNGHSSVIDWSDIDKSFEASRNNIQEISSDVIDTIWNRHTKMTRYIRAYLEINLKN